MCLITQYGDVAVRATDLKAAHQENSRSQSTEQQPDSRIRKDSIKENDQKQSGECHLHAEKLRLYRLYIPLSPSR
ncbi:hypothetical protein DVK00_13710 [Haloarcula sp. Atlit-47R]|nr:hypothetical protein DVK00_13710 [Haloarcula sp. Atlit-47R]